MYKRAFVQIFSVFTGLYHLSLIGTYQLTSTSNSVNLGKMKVAFWFRVLLTNFGILSNLSFRHFTTKFSDRSSIQYSYSYLSMASDTIPVMVNGLPGLMALETAKSCVDHGLNLLPYGFTGGDITKKTVTVEGKLKSVEVELLKGPGVTGNKADDFLQSLKKEYPNLIIIDYTHPSAVLNNVNSYVTTNVDFVMGTTGGDPVKIQEVFNKGSNIAIISPNMAKQIVALQATLLETSRKYPNSFKNYKLTVRSFSLLYHLNVTEILLYLFTTS